MHAKKSTDRLVAFTDAVVAIAITLLVLPLADLVVEAAKEHQTPQRLLIDNRWQIYSFLLSFVVIARMWVSHHQFFEKVSTHSRWLIRWNILWLLFIVILPFPTELTAVFQGDRFTIVIYIAVVLACDFCLSAMEYLVYRNPALATDRGAVSRMDVGGSAVTVLILLLALVLAQLVPQIYEYSLLLLIIPNTYKRITNRRKEKQDQAEVADDEVDAATEV